jgi:hypothetical protein
MTPNALPEAVLTAESNQGADAPESIHLSPPSKEITATDSSARNG